MVVTIVSTELVPARNSNSNVDELHKKRIELTPYDLRPLQAIPMEWGLFFLKPQQPSDHQTHKYFVQHLKNSLSLTLEFFFPLAGRLASVEHVDDGDGSKIKGISFFIDCDNQGAQFVHAVAGHVTVADILEPIFVPSILHSFFPLNGIKNYHGVANPLLGIQVTELADGFFVGCSMNHSVADGSTFWKFFNSWSEISRQLWPEDPKEEDNRRHIIISKPPLLDRSIFGIGFPIRLPNSSKDFAIEQPPLPQPPSSVKTRVFHFSKTKIADLKKRARSNISNYGNHTVTISSVQSLLDHVWRSMLRNGGVAELKGEETTNTTLVFAVGTRSRFKVPLPEEYFGNAIDMREVTLSVGEVLLKEGYAALQINKVVASHTSDEVAKRLESWVQNPTLLTLGGMPENLFIVVGSPRFHVYGNDFGWGKPVAVRGKPVNQIGGLVAVMTMYPGVEEGSIDIEIISSPQSVENLRNDSDF